MIWESAYWKDDLLKDAAIIRRWAHKANSERRDILLEKKIFVAAYVIRKLFEARKISTYLIDLPICCDVIPNAGKQARAWNWHHLDRLFDFSRRTAERRKLSFIVNQIIHSYVFAVSIDDREYVDGFFVSSDREKQKRLFWISIDTFIDVIEKIGNDDPKSYIRYIEPETGVEKIFLE